MATQICVMYTLTLGSGIGGVPLDSHEYMLKTSFDVSFGDAILPKQPKNSSIF